MQSTQINQKLIAATICFIAGTLTEIYTFNKTNDIKKSTGIGWGLAAVFFLSI